MSQTIELIGTRGKKITRIGSLSAVSVSLKALKLRSNLIGRMADVSGLTKLVELELYENRIRKLEGLEGMACEQCCSDCWPRRELCLRSSAASVVSPFLWLQH